MATLEMLHGLFGSELNQHVVCFGSMVRTLRLRGGFTLDQQPLDALADLPSQPSLLLHYAYLTRDKVGLQRLQDYIEANRRISAYVAEHAHRIGAERVLITSSGAVYNHDRSLADDLDRNPYGVLKLEDEQRFIRWAESHNAVAVIPRVFNLSGPYINKIGTYALAALILDALAGERMRIKATRPVIRSYTSIAQLVSVSLGLLLEDVTKPFIQFDTAGECEVEIGELAVRINEALGFNIPIERDEIDMSHPDRYVGDGKRYEGLTRRLAVTQDPLATQIHVTMADLRARGV